MAHSCPVCGGICHCGGDIDDICFDETEEMDDCTCCAGAEDDWDDELIAMHEELFQELEGRAK